MFPLDLQDIDHVAREVWLLHARLIGIALHILGLDEIPLPICAARALSFDFALDEYAGDQGRAVYRPTSYLSLFRSPSNMRCSSRLRRAA